MFQELFSGKWESQKHTDPTLKDSRVYLVGE